MTRPELRELECFVAVADHGNFSRAARHLNLSQPPLTRHIQALEAKIGTRLLTRDTHSVALTAPGILFLEDARNILGMMDRAAETARRAQHGETARLRLAFVGVLLDERLVGLIRLFRTAHPDCQLQMTDLPPAEQLRALKAGELDGGFIGAKPSHAPAGIALTMWKKEPFTLALPEGHPLAHIEPLRWKQLENLSWVMVSRAAAPAFRRQFSGFCRQRNLSVNIVQESDRVPAILTMVAAGSGVTVVPESVAHLLTRGIVFRPLPAPRLILEHTFAYRTKKTPESLRQFLGLFGKVKSSER